jgi:uncharacterized protein YggL (DUF469 family)
LAITTQSERREVDHKLRARDRLHLAEFEVFGTVD